ncbi:hypothetical protein CG392_01125 [Gardnerella vaginalis]|uniref:Uncharacterized protein n=1 Tax=Gardnerella piotii TaxID=2792977 RepID=A0ABU5MQJ1_9BIFI|nr:MULTISPECIES: hypothetical protein [Gardnerella]EPI44411.1 hypothetical protein HMPREF1586_00187 [Gardnerella vaginalis JCP8522]RIY19015.1 hypothetical protein CJI54_06180 [Bifidobacteriaceae bacterium NR026]MDZ7544683.1 hypothetical protein [Gardnerella piotii]MDZ7551953.1 hypothetical protein [Gardnerella piotii]RDX00440.1 membrane protein [Gardnerella vaginalis]
MKVSKNTLLLIACLVWGFAGFNILKIGVNAYSNFLTPINFTLSLAVFVIFQVFIFGKLVKKHVSRINAYKENKQFFLKFFDVKSFIIMAFMMTFGIVLRATNIAPERFIAVFYTGLGSALALAGLLFGYHFAKTACPRYKNTHTMQ